ncbi:MAG: hypothetical protein HUJ63_06460, partial [Enterococcus sp.]|nr:hypothetical protein [Enterococcus sp.]
LSHKQKIANSRLLGSQYKCPAFKHEKSLIIHKMSCSTKTQTKNFFASYVRFFAGEAKNAAYLMGPDNAVGDMLHFETVSTPNALVTEILNRFDKKIGILEPQDSHDIRILEEKDWQIFGLLDYVAVHTEVKTNYCAGVLLLAAPNKYSESLENFTMLLSSELSEGKRLDALLSPSEQKEMFANNGEFLPTRRRALEKEENFKYLKTEASLKEKIYEQGRQKNPGCYIVSISFLVLIAAGLIFLLLKFLSII